MGLDAIVFKGADSLKIAFGKHLFRIDPSTGEPQFESPEVDVQLGDMIAIQKHIGNVSEVAFLWETMAKILNPGDSVIMDKILYSGSHSGDYIAKEAIPLLKQEVKILKDHGGPELRPFIDTLASLIDAALVEQNPIVFV